MVKQAEVKEEVKTVTLISEARIRNFDVDPSWVVKIHRGAEDYVCGSNKFLRIKPGAIVTFTEEAAKKLLTYKDFKVYGMAVV
jgi:hypothetical protein